MTTVPAVSRQHHHRTLVPEAITWSAAAATAVDLHTAPTPTHTKHTHPYHKHRTRRWCGRAGMVRVVENSHPRSQVRRTRTGGRKSIFTASGPVDCLLSHHVNLNQQGSFVHFAQTSEEHLIKHFTVNGQGHVTSIIVCIFSRPPVTILGRPLSIQLCCIYLLSEVQRACFHFLPPL